MYCITNLYCYKTRVFHPGQGLGNKAGSFKLVSAATAVGAEHIIDEYVVFQIFTA